MPTPPAVHRIGGVACIVLALICFGALDTTSKVAAALAPVGLALWVRYLVQTIATAAILWPRQRARLLHSRRPLLQALRAALLVSCNGIAFVSLAHMHVGEFSAIVTLTPLLLTVVAALALREPVSGLGGLAITSLGLPLAWQALPPSSWGVLLLMGGFGALGHCLLIMAYARTPVAILTPYLYLQIGFGALGGWIVFSHVPDGPALTGIALICVCGVYGTWLTGREIIARSQREAAQSSIAAIAGADEH